MARWPRASLLWGRREPEADATKPSLTDLDADGVEIVDPSEADTDAATARAARDALRPDPSKIGGVGDAPFACLPVPSTLFRARAERLDAIAVEHPLGDYLRLLAVIARVQHATQAARPAPLLVADVAQRLEHAMPALVASDLAEADFAATLGLLLDGVDEQFTASTTPTATMEAVSRLRDMPPAEQLELAAAVFAGSYPADRLGECLFVAAALQVHLAQSAALLDVAALHPVADGVCPACGSGPVASLIVGWTRAAKTRYCACSLCATQWNHVRIKCTSCSATSAILYRGVKELSENISVETCDTCHSYIKHMQQHAEPLLDPVADDIASFGLDVLVRDEGYRRGGLNPLFIQG